MLLRLTKGGVSISTVPLLLAPDGALPSQAELSAELGWQQAERLDRRAEKLGTLQREDAQLLRSPPQPLRLLPAQLRAQLRLAREVYVVMRQQP